MEIIKIYPRGFGANSYILTADNKTAVVIDPAQPRIESELIRRGLTPKYVLLTHCHFDHVAGVACLQNAGAKVVCGKQEKSLVGTFADLFEAFGAPRENFVIDETMEDNQTRVLCDVKITALHTAGHTAGGVCYLVEEDDKKYLFTGDTLFAGSIGRTDFPTGDLSALRQSLRRLLSLEDNSLDDIPIYSGHGEDTSLKVERQTNPFLLDL